MEDAGLVVRLGEGHLRSSSAPWRRGWSSETQARWSDYAAISRPRLAVVPCVHHVQGHSGVLFAVFFIIKF